MNVFFSLGKQDQCVLWLEGKSSLHHGPERGEDRGVDVALGVQVSLRAGERLVKPCCCLELILSYFV